MAVEIKPMLLQVTQRVRTQITPSFLNYDVYYRVDEIQEGPILVSGWSRHNTNQFLIPLRGQICLESRDASHTNSMDLLPGKKYKIPAGLDHRLFASSGLLESFLLESGQWEAPTHLDEKAWQETGEQRSLSSRVTTTIIVEYTPRPGVSGQDGRVEVDTQVPGTGLGRKVYFSPLDCERKLPCPHKHNTGHMLACMAGKAWLAYRESGESVQTQEMVPGYIYVVPPQLPHQMRMEQGSVVASYFPAATWLSREEELEELDEDWFL